MASTSKMCVFCGREFSSTYTAVRHEESCGYLHDNSSEYFIEKTPTHIPKKLCTTPTAPSPMEWESEHSFNSMVQTLCAFCGKNFSSSLDRSLHEVLHKKNYCAKCGRIFNSINEKNIHETPCNVELLCSSCGGLFNTTALFNAHSHYCQYEFNNQRNPYEPHVGELLAQPPNNEQIHPYETSFANRLASCFIQSDFALDLPLFLNNIQIIRKLIINYLSTHGPIKFSLFVDCVLENAVGEQLEGNLKTKFEILLDKDELDDKIKIMFAILNDELGQLETKGSGWKLATVLGLRLKVCKYSPLRGGANIELPKCISDRKACINVPGSDDMCFK